MTKYSHSGSLGDLIYSLPVIKSQGGGSLTVNLRSVHKVSAAYGYNVTEIPDFHMQMISDDTYSQLVPLLNYQSYITDVKSSEYEDDTAEVKLDQFRGVLWKTFKGNYIEGYFKTFNIPYSQDSIGPWLTAPSKRVASTIITRTARYTSDTPEVRTQWKSILEQNKDDCMFVGLFDEWSAFCGDFGIEIPLYMNSDLLDLASVVNAADHVVSNQTLTYAIATGLGKRTTLESWAAKPLIENECYFNRPGLANYF